eukprot:364378-Chlamydomonas_euryale.AAC.5
MQVVSALLLRCPRRHKLTLYAHISRIKWRLDRDDRIAGSVGSQNGGGMQFAFRPCVLHVWRRFVRRGQPAVGHALAFAFRPCVRPVWRRFFRRGRAAVGHDAGFGIRAAAAECVQLWDVS